MARHKKHTKSDHGNRHKDAEIEAFLKAINPLWHVFGANQEWLLDLEVPTPINGKFYVTEAVYICISDIITENGSRKSDLASVFMLAHELDLFTHTILDAAVKAMLSQICTGKNAVELGLVCFKVEHSNSKTLLGFRSDCTLLNDDFSGDIIIRLHD